MSRNEGSDKRHSVIGNRIRSGETESAKFYSSSFENLFKVKVVVVGDVGVGKTCLATRFVKGTFEPAYELTIGAGFLCKAVELPDYTIIFQIWDTAGQERYRSLVSMYLRDAKAALLVYDVTDLNSYINVSEWLKQLRTYSPEDIKIILVAAKCDLSSAVHPTTANEYATKNEMLFMETSSKTGLNIDKLFTTLASIMNVRREADTDSELDQKKKNVLDITNSDSHTKQQCCSS
ncbi:hypothetical protein CHS0354_001705 [Potamilus streckersoni]|uniref:Uncharacterized protein n=1 Tax=Potamilus streckersoni TaxID=2493646 RepID=A0AAE0S0E6_9BIVA|nr:hypothetical protein CHS0354_001705 [Potamilus streckersoni]